MNTESKHERMEIRKEIGNRIITPPSTPPYNRGAEYLIAQACFDCRKSFKIRPAEEEKNHHCPECGNELHEMGRNFRPPKKTDKKKWEAVKKLYLAGFRFFGSGFHDGEPLPEKPSEVDRFIKENPNHPLKINRTA